MSTDNSKPFRWWVRPIWDVPFGFPDYIAVDPATEEEKVMIEFPMSNEELQAAIDSVLKAVNNPLYTEEIENHMAALMKVQLYRAEREENMSE